MSKASEQLHPPRQTPSSGHLENLIELRACNPQAYARLGEGSRRTVEQYEMERLAATFRHHAGTERLLELKERLPEVYARFSEQTKASVEEYAEKKHAYRIVTGPPLR